MAAVELVAVISGKGGSGKSCITAYTGIALAAAGKKTLLVEAGASSRSLDIIMAASLESAFDLGDVLCENCTPEEAIAPVGTTGNLFLLPSPVGGFSPGSEPFAHLLKTLRRQYDFVLVDGADLFALPAGLFDTILMVSTPDTLSVRACQNLAHRLYRQREKALRLVINGVPSSPLPIQGVQDFDDIIDLISAQLIAVLPYSQALAASVSAGTPLEQSSVMPRVFDNLAARLCGSIRPLLFR